MKMIKNMMFKRTVIFLCCTFILSSSLFMSYQVPVHAETTYGDLLEDAIYIAGAAAGIFFSGGTLTPALLIPFLEKLAGTGFDVYDYITQNEEDGTTTISADFINLVLQAYKQYNEENGMKFDGTMAPGQDGYYCFPDFSATMYEYSYTPGEYSYMHRREYKNICTSLPCAVLIRNDYTHGSFNETMGHIIFYSKSLDEFYTYYDLNWGGEPYEDIIRMNSQQFIDGYFIPINNETSLKITRGDGTIQELEKYKFDHLSLGYFNVSKGTCYISAKSSSIPIYYSLDGLKQGLRSGDFSGAYNYGQNGGYESSSYTGTYDGGDITVLTEKLEGIRDKLDDLDKAGKDIDEKLKELLEWLIGHTGETGGSIDLTTTNSWLEKIYKKVSQIFDTISGTVNTKLQETLDEILDTLKSIRRWTIADTVFDGLDALADIASFLKDFLTAPAAAIGTAASSLGDAADMLTDRFPFSIPWDMAALVTLLSAEPQAPVFKLPIVIESYGIEEYIEIDMSQYEYLSTIMRGMLSIIYAYGILSMTTKVIDTGGKK